MQHTRVGKQAEEADAAEELQQEEESHALIIDERRFPVRRWKPREQLVGDRGEVASDLPALLVQGLLDKDDGIARNHTVDDVALLCGDTCKRRSSNAQRLDGRAHAPQRTVAAVITVWRRCAQTTRSRCSHALTGSPCHQRVPL